MQGYQYSKAHFSLYGLQETKTVPKVDYLAFFKDVGAPDFHLDHLNKTIRSDTIDVDADFRNLVAKVEAVGILFGVKFKDQNKIFSLAEKYGMI